MFLSKNLNLVRSKILNFNQISKIASTTSYNAIFKIQDDRDFVEKVEQSKEPVLTVFFADWCGPCKLLAPRLENVLSNTKEKINVARVNIDDLGDIAVKFDVSSVPALVVIQNGKAKERLVGLQDEDILQNWVHKIVQNQ